MEQIRVLYDGGLRVSIRIMEWVIGSLVGVAFVGAFGGATEAVVAKIGVCAGETTVIFFSCVTVRDGEEVILGK
jgi:hypothetical protein